MPTCRICKGSSVSRFLDLGNQPHCNHFLTKEEVGREPFYPLDVSFCEECALVQLATTVPRETMFRNYPYVSGTTRTLTDHFHRLAKDLVRRFEIPPGSLVVDIGSNDGTFLRGYAGTGVRTLGVDPATNIAQIARREGIDTIDDFFGADLARRIVQEYGKARLITAAGVFFHVEDLDDFVAGVRELLAPNGVFVVQALYLVDILEKTSFDNIYHEHLCLYSLKPLQVLFRRFDLEIVDAERADIHGGSITISVRFRGRESVRESVARVTELERNRGVYELQTYRDFALRVEKIKQSLVGLLKDLKGQGKRIAAYGAPAKGNTLLNYCRIGTDLLDYAVEKNPLKCGLFTPGMHIPVVHEDEVRGNPPDYFLLLPWNFGEEILKKEVEFLGQGGHFIIPVPGPRIFQEEGQWP